MFAENFLLRRQPGLLPQVRPRPPVRLQDQGPNSIEKPLEKPLEKTIEKPLEFWLEIPYTKK